MFGKQRTYDLKGVTIPSQQRYIRYFEDLKNNEYFKPTYRYMLASINILTVPNYSVMSGALRVLARSNAQGHRSPLTSTPPAHALHAQHTLTFDHAAAPQEVACRISLCTKRIRSTRLCLTRVTRCGASSPFSPFGPDSTFISLPNLPLPPPPYLYHQIDVVRVSKRQGGFSFKNLYDSDIRVAGNVRIEFYHQSSGKSKTGGSTLMFSCWLHTAFIPDKNLITLSRKELDGAHKDKQRFDSNLQLQLHWEKLECVDDDEAAGEAAADGVASPPSTYSLSREAGDETHRLLLRQLAMTASGSERRGSAYSRHSSVSDARRGSAVLSALGMKEDLDEDEQELVNVRSSSHALNLMQSSSLPADADQAPPVCALTSQGSAGHDASHGVMVSRGLGTANDPAELQNCRTAEPPSRQPANPPIQ